jgi:hypothetical protein
MVARAHLSTVRIVLKITSYSSRGITSSPHMEWLSKRIPRKTARIQSCQKNVAVLFWPNSPRFHVLGDGAAMNSALLRPLLPALHQRTKSSFSIFLPLYTRHLQHGLPCASVIAVYPRRSVSRFPNESYSLLTCSLTIALASTSSERSVCLTYSLAPFFYLLLP